MKLVGHIDMEINSMSLYFFLLLVPLSSNAVPDRLVKHQHDTFVLDSFGTMLLGISAVAGLNGYNCFQDHQYCYSFPCVNYLVTSLASSIFFISGCGVLWVSAKLKSQEAEEHNYVYRQLMRQDRNRRGIVEIPPHNFVVYSGY